MSAKAPDAADAVIGRNIRLQRLSNGMSLSELGHQLGITFQQVQKYESGSNRVVSGRLVRIADVLDVPLMTLFDGVKGLDRRPAAYSASGLMAGRHAFRLALAFSQIDDSGVRRAVVKLVETVARRPQAWRGAGK